MKISRADAWTLVVLNIPAMVFAALAVALAYHGDWGLAAALLFFAGLAARVFNESKEISE